MPPRLHYVFVNATIAPKAGDLAVFIDEDFSKLTDDEIVNAQIAVVRQDSHGKLYGHISNPEEKITAQTMHKVIMVVMQ